MNRVLQTALSLGCVWSVVTGCGQDRAPREVAEAPPSPYADVSDPALLADPVALRAAFGLPGDNRPSAFSPFDGFADRLARRRGPAAINATCPTNEQATWLTSTSSPGADITWATAASCDTVYEAGYTNKALTSPVAPGGLLPFAGQDDLYVIGRDLNGTALWAKEIGTPGTDFATAAVATPCAAPFVYIVGHSNGNFAGTSAGNFDLIAMKLTAGGTEVWRRQFGSSQNEQSWGAALDATGNLYVVGQSFGNLPGAGTNFPTGTTSAFVVKFDANGNRIWARQLGVNNRTTVARGVAVAGNDVYVTGYTSAALDGQAFAGGSFDAFFVRYDGAGTRQVADTKLLGTPALDQGYSITTTTEAAGTFVYVTGFTNGTLPGKTNLGANTYDIFVTKLDSHLVPVWLDQLGGSTSVTANAGNVITATAGTIFVAGSTDRTLDPTDTDLGSLDIAMIAYNPDGTKATIDYLGTNGSEAAQAISSDQGGNVYVGGRADSSVCGHAFGGGGVDGLLFRHMTGCNVNSTDTHCKVGGGSGDPHYMNFHGRRFDEQAAGTFILSRFDEAVSRFQVQVRQCPASPGARVALIEAVGMRIDRDTVEYNAAGELYVNGALTPVAGTVALPDGGAIYAAARGGLVFAWPEGHRVVARAFGNRYMNVSVVVGPPLFGKLDGFLGDAATTPTDDFMMTRAGDVRQASISFVDEYRAPVNFSSTWRVDPASGDLALITHGVDCTDPAFPANPTTTANLTTAQRTAGQTACAAIADDSAREDCTLDVGITGDPLLAQIAQDATAQLANQGVTTTLATNPASVYFNDFSGTVGPEWNAIVSSVTPLGDRTFLGTFGNETVRLTLNDLAPHAQILVSFDLYVVNGWDGEGPFGPNTWRAVADGREIVSYTFSNTFSTQSFPAPGSAAGTGAAEVNTLFYPFGDSVYRITLAIPHSASSLALDLSADGLSGIFGEAWGMANFEVRGSRTP